MEYISIIYNTEICDSLIENSKAPNKKTIASFLKYSIEQITSSDDYCPDFIEEVIRINKSFCFYTELDDYVELIYSKIITKLKGNFKEYVDILDEHYLSSLNCAVISATECIDLLNSDCENFEACMRISKYVHSLKFLDISSRVLHQGEIDYESKMRGIAASKRKKLKKSCTIKLAMSIAKKVWEREPSISSNTVAQQIHYQIEDMLNDFRETGSRRFIKYGLFEIHDKSKSQVTEFSDKLPIQAHRNYGSTNPDNDDSVCVPAILESSDSIRYHIRPLRPDNSITRTSDELRKKVDSIIEHELE